jgi:hypothetical protein
MRASKVADRLPLGPQDATTLGPGGAGGPASRTDTADELWGVQTAGAMLLGL